MSKESIEEYKGLAEYVRESYEKVYSNKIMLGEKEKAHEAVKKLMEYRLIPTNDERCSVKCKLFGGNDGINVKEESNWGRFDYRRDSDYLPVFLYCELRERNTIEIDTYEYWGKRVEGNYEGDIKVGSFRHKIRVNLVTRPQEARNAVSEMCSMAKNLHANIGNDKAILEEVLVGVLRIFRIDMSTSVENKNKHVGFVIGHVNDDSVFESVALVDYSVLQRTWIPIEQFMKELENVMHCVSSIPENCKMGTILDKDVYVEQQRLLVNDQKAMDDKQQKLREQEKINKAEKAAAKAAEKEAKAAEKEAKAAEKAAKNK